MFFSFLAVFPLPESYQNDPKFHFNTLLRSDTQKSSKNVENTTVFWSRCETVFGVWSRCETVFGPPPPPAKADIATAILTNVIEHLVLLLPPNKHAFTAKAVWADFNKGAAYSFLPSFAPRVLLLLLLLRPSSCAILVFCGHQGTRMSQQVPAQAEHFPESYRELQVNLGTHRPEPHRELRIQLGTRGLEDLNLLASFRPNWACTDPNTY